MDKVKKVKFWDERQEDSCGYCIHARVMSDSKKIICNKKNNILNFSDSCSRFKFDILKKNLKRQKRPNFNKYSKENFTL